MIQMNSLAYQLLDAYQEDGHVMEMKIVLMVRMKKRIVVELELAVPMNSAVVVKLANVFQCLGFATSIMIALMDLMRNNVSNRKNVPPEVLSAGMEGAVRRHGSVMDKMIVGMEVMKKDVNQ